MLLVSSQADAASEDSAMVSHVFAKGPALAIDEDVEADVEGRELLEHTVRGQWPTRRGCHCRKED